MIWRCPRCRGELSAEGDVLRSKTCGAIYEQIDGIADLRVPGDSWVDFHDDSATARELARGNYDLPDLVREVYRRRPDWDEARIELRSIQVLEGPCRLREEISGWLRDAAQPNKLFLDLGCGAGVLLAAATASGRQGIGVDVSMTWLVVAKRLITAWGGKPILAAALGEALPLADGAVNAVISLDVIEHVRDTDQYLREINRVTQGGGRLALSTPNRFSLTSEPHVFVWGVGWLPSRLQPWFVQWRSGKSYTDTRLLSSFDLERKLERFTQFKFEVIIPPVPEQEMNRFPVLKRRLAKLYNLISAIPITHRLFRLVGPFFRVVGKKR